MKQFSILLALTLLWSCSNMDYDTSKGIDREVTLFSDQISLPLGGVGPLTPRFLIDKVGMGDMLKSLVQEDEEGYLVVTKKESFYSNPVLLFSYLLPDPTKPSVVTIDGYYGELESTASLRFSLFNQIAYVHEKVFLNRCLPHLFICCRSSGL